MQKTVLRNLLIISFCLLAFFGFLPNKVYAASKTFVTVILRDSAGDFIPNANFELYQQVEDVDGSPKPNKKVASGKINENLGKGEVSFADDNGSYAIKAWTVNSGNAAFWFYDNLKIASGTKTEVTEYLSGINVVLRDSDGEVRKNTKFSIYTQKDDVDGQPIRAKKDLVGTFDTAEIGQVKVYLPSSSRAVDGNGPDYYVFESTGKSGGIFTKYNISINDKHTSNLEYKFSDMKLELKDANGLTFPGNIKIEIFKQSADDDDKKVLGDFVKTIYTDDKGVAYLEYPSGEYAARITGKNNQYQYFWDLDINDQERETYSLKSDESWDSGTGACEANSLLTLYTRGLKGELIPGLKFEIFERLVDDNNNPIAGNKLGGGTTDQAGMASISINPDSRKWYILKIYDENAKVGDFWFFDDIQFTCGLNKEITKYLPALNIVLRDGYGKLKKNQKFSLYAQQYDVDGGPIISKNELVGNFSTTDQGSYVIYLAPSHSYDLNKRGIYVFSSTGESGGTYNEYNIIMASDADNKFDYTFSDIEIELKDAGGHILKNKNLDLYAQTAANGKNSLGKKLKSIKTDGNGLGKIEYSAGQYALVIKDDLNQDNIIWDVVIKNRTHNRQTITANLTRIKVKDAGGKDKRGADIFIYSLVDNGTGGYVKEKKIKSFKIQSSGYIDVSLAPNPYLAAVMYGSVEYGKSFYAENGKMQTISLEPKLDDQSTAAKIYKLATPQTIGSIIQRLKGYILLQVESRGEAWYVNPADGKRYYLKDGEEAYEIMRKLGIGATDASLNKIIIGTNDRLEEFDYDGDGLSDNTESAIGTDMYSDDSDNDSFKDGDEAKGGYNPLGSGRLPIDKRFSVSQKGKILLQVEKHGEAWYINPKDGFRYYMKDGDSAYEIMRFLSLGVKNSDLDKIEVGTLSN